MLFIKLKSSIFLFLLLIIIPFLSSAQNNFIIGIKGVLWYRGESNVSYANEYYDLFSSMIKGWREKWNAKIENDKVIVWAHKPAELVEVRYAWLLAGEANLFDKEGMPAFPFRKKITNQK